MGNSERQCVSPYSKGNLLLNCLPYSVQAQALVDFWLEIFRVQVEARSGALRLHLSGKDGGIIVHCDLAH
jgi:hypothetical protein